MKLTIEIDKANSMLIEQLSNFLEISGFQVVSGKGDTEEAYYHFVPKDR